MKFRYAIIILCLILFGGGNSPLFAQETSSQPTFVSVSESVEKSDFTETKPTIELDARKLTNQSILDSLFNSLKGYKNDKNNEGVALVLYRIGLFYGDNDKIDLNNGKGAIPYLVKSISLYEEISNGRLFSKDGGTNTMERSINLTNEELQKGIGYLKTGLIKYKDLGRLEDIALVNNVLS